MKIDYASVLLLALLPLVVKTTLYFLAFRIRSIHIKFINCVVVAGASYLTGVIPIPLPFVLRMAITVGLAMFLMTRYTEAELFPDTLLIPIAVELASLVVMDQILQPLLT